MKFYYIDTPRQYDAGIMEIGHFVSPLMIIPPKAENYTVYGFCSPSCTQVKYINTSISFDVVHLY